VGFAGWMNLGDKEQTTAYGLKVVSGLGGEEFVGILRCAQDDGKGSEQRLDT
jgi:hypothetical protein